jgi:hypothetical protein
MHFNIWSYDYVSERTHDGRALKLLTVIDEHTRQCLAIKVARKIRAHDVLEVLADLFAQYGPPEHLRSECPAHFARTSVVTSSESARVFNVSFPEQRATFWSQSGLRDRGLPLELLQPFLMADYPRLVEKLAIDLDLDAEVA